MHPSDPDGNFVMSREYQGRDKSLHDVATPAVDTNEMKRTEWDPD